VYQKRKNLDNTNKVTPNGENEIVPTTNLQNEKDTMDYFKENNLASH
jgi:hypothetical protein